MKLVYRSLAVLAVIMFSAFNLSAKNWFLTVEPIGGWTAEDESVSVTYKFNQNPIRWGGSSVLIPILCEPTISVTIKNNTDDFIYLDLAKTYILRNGETELFQNQITMSTTQKDNEGDASQKSMSQTVMPIPPHATKKLTFNYFVSKKNTGYEPFIRAGYQWIDMYYVNTNTKVTEGTVFNYKLDNSPAITTISFAYSKTEDSSKQTRITKDIYVNKAALLKNVKPKTINATLPNLDNETYFTLYYQ